MIRLGIVDFDTSHAGEFTKRLNHIDIAEDQWVEGARVVAGVPGESKIAPELIPKYTEQMEKYGVDALRRPRGPLRQGRRRDDRVGRRERPPRPRTALPEEGDAHLRRQAVRVLAGRRQGDVQGGDGVARPLDVELEPPVRPRGRRRAGGQGGERRGDRRVDLRAGPDAPEEPRALPLRDPPGRDALHADGAGLHAADLPQPARVPTSSRASGATAGSAASAGIRAGKPSTASPSSARRTSPRRASAPEFIYRELLKRIVSLFETRQLPIDPRETLEIVAFIEAARKSGDAGGAPMTITV